MFSSLVALSFPSTFPSSPLKMCLSCLSSTFLSLHPSNLPVLNLTPGIYQVSRPGLKLPGRLGVAALCHRESDVISLIG